MPGVKVITPADLSASISIADLRAHCRTGTAEDAQLTAFLAGAVAYAEHYTGRAIGSQTLELALDTFPAGAIELPRGSVTNITSITYVDEAGVTQTMSNTLYTLDNYDALQCWAVPAVDNEWPAISQVANAVKVRYVAGELTPAVRNALLMLVANSFEHREESSESQLHSVPLGVKSMLDTVKVWGI